MICADDRNIVADLAGGLPRRRVHGLAAVLRPGVPHGDAARVHGLPERPARPRRLRRVPHRPRRAVVRAVEAVGHAAAVRRRAQDLSRADSLARREPAARARHVRTVPLAREVHGRPRPARSASTPTTRRTPKRRPRCSCTSGAAATAPARTAFTGTWRRRPGSPTSRPTPSGRRSSGWKWRTAPACATFRAEGVTDEQLGEGRAARDGLHGLPQPSQPPLRLDARTGRERGASPSAGSRRRCRSCGARRWRR